MTPSVNLRRCWTDKTLASISHLCVQQDARSTARRAGLSATAGTCLQQSGGLSGLLDLVHSVLLLHCTLCFHLLLREHSGGDSSPGTRDGRPQFRRIKHRSNPTVEEDQNQRHQDYDPCQRVIRSRLGATITSHQRTIAKHLTGNRRTYLHRTMAELSKFLYTEP